MTDEKLKESSSSNTKKKQTQINMSRIFGLGGMNQPRTQNMFGIPSDGLEGLAMKQRYRGLQRMDTLREKPVPAPTKRLSSEDRHSGSFPNL